MPIDDPTPERLRRIPSRQLTQAAAHAHRIVAHRLADFRTHHYAVMAALDEAGPCSQAALGRMCRMDRSDIVTAVDDLAARGLVVRSPDETDRRRNTVSLTPEGSGMLRHLDEQVRLAQDDLFEPLSPEERAHLASLLGRVLEYHTHLDGTH
ncbi:MarR family winged helix-turn-helix transcriptional regulator [Phytoactinopolyspora halophila]|nr:MarR family transcriptional regulator [Phytoactinopolyspora halophila]